MSAKSQAPTNADRDALSGGHVSDAVLLDYYAGKALEGAMPAFMGDSKREIWADYDDFASTCFNAAVAMLRERQIRIGK